MDSTTALMSGLGTLVIAIGYIVVKRFSRSNCASHTACCECESPAVTLARENTERLDKIIDKLEKGEYEDNSSSERIIHA